MLIIKSYNLFILLKLIISIYIAWTSIENDSTNYIVVIFILLYIIAIFIKGMVRKYNILFKLFSIIEAVIAIIFATNYLSLASLLISILIVEFSIKEIKNKYIGLFLSVLPLIFLLKDNNFIDAAIILVIMIIFISIYEAQLNKLKKLDEIQEEQRRIIYSLQKKLVDEHDIQEQILYTARLEERNKISARLHDKIGHTISGTLLQLEASKFILENDKEKGISMLNSCTENLRNGMEEIRMTLRNIKPKEEELGINRIKKILDEKIKDTNIKGKVVYSGDLENVSTGLWIVFIHIITELTTNSIKYSNGDLIEVKIEILNKIIKLEVKDNGLGCKKVKKSIGLRNIEESVSNLKGKLIIDSDDGFKVIVLIPY
ncbi:sensor histidine kinase [Clostridium nigeriense]|uniref:sensor histidine kinase n=1 Tax=Clostridium nigeriense TaxID=1805470 RepID=UPI003D32F177